MLNLAALIGFGGIAIGVALYARVVFLFSSVYSSGC
jgi:uncharacterized membrane protein YtjA (UPF0391 family)